MLSNVEPWCDTIYVDTGLLQDYIQVEQSKTSFNLYERVKPYDNEKNNEILVTIDGNKFTQQDFQIINQLSAIIADSGEVGEFELGNLKIEIFKIKDSINDLICL
jgi:hypothetical protein